MKFIENSLKIKNKINQIIKDSVQVFGKVKSISKSTIEFVGIHEKTSIGDLVYVHKNNGDIIMCEVLGITKDSATILPFDNFNDIQIDNKVNLGVKENFIYPDITWKGRVIDAFCNPMDGKESLLEGEQKYFLNNKALSFNKRSQVGKKISLGTRVIDTFTSCCTGQRMGIFSGSGIGKSILISMLTKYSKVDIKIIGLIGERSREINEFINENLSQQDKENSIIIASSSNESPLTKKRAAYLTLTIAEYFRDLGCEVLCMIDSITRLAMAQREIGLASGEKAISKGYTPSVFSLLPSILERAGPGSKKGNITGLFTVLVEGDDHNEPISDCIRSILDGHIVLDREIAEKNIFPAVNIFKSVSRMMPKCNTKEENNIINKVKHMLKMYYDMEDMINLGLYKKGSNTELDNTIKLYDKLKSFLKQDISETTSMEDSYKILSRIINENKDE